MANPDDQYLTMRGIARMVVDLALDRLACLRRGHDPVNVDVGILCRRCLRAIP